MPTLLDYLRGSSRVSADTLDIATVQQLGPFVDATSNQAIVSSTIEGGRDQANITALLQDAAERTVRTSEDGEDEDRMVRRAVNIATVLLARRLLPHLSGRIHIQVDPRVHDSVDGLVASAREIASIFRSLENEQLNDVNAVSRLVVKIPATWHGLEACRILEQDGLATLATILYHPAQAVRAGQVACSYIAPYVYDLRVHFGQSFRDPAPNFAVCPAAQRFYARKNMLTQTLPASLTSVDDCMRLAAANYITIAAPLLQKLASTMQPEDGSKLGSYDSVYKEPVSANENDVWDHVNVDTEEHFEKALGPDIRAKIKVALDIFCEKQSLLESRMKDYLSGYQHLKR